jgi:hypothetical protein
MAIEPFTSAALSITGLTFDSIGGLYLAYDLLGGEGGPLSKITRIVTYSLLAVFIYSFAGNLKFALVCGIGLGSIFGLQLDWIGAGKKVNLKMMIVLSIARMIIIGVASSFVLPIPVALIVCAGAFFGSMASQKMKLSPEYWYEASRKPVFSFKRIGLGLILGTFMTLMVLFGETICGDKNGLASALRLGFTVGIGTGLIASVSPFVEWYADNLPPRKMGYIGAVMFMIGFAIQSIPSLVVLLGL